MGGRCVDGGGALKRLDSVHVEIKSMRSVDEFRRRGVAARMQLDESAELGWLSKTKFELEVTGLWPARSLLSAIRIRTV